MLYHLGVGNAEVLRNTYAVIGVSGGAIGATSYPANLASLYQYQLNGRRDDQSFGDLLCGVPQRQFSARARSDGSMASAIHLAWWAPRCLPV